MARLDRVTGQRQEKLERICSRGIKPYPHGYHRTHTTQQAVALLGRQEEEKIEAPAISVAGRIMASRLFGKISFMDVHDSTGKLQLLFRIGDFDEAANQLLKDLDIGDIIGASGKLFRTRTGEPTLEVTSFVLLAKSLQPLPEKWHGLVDVEKRYRQRYLDLTMSPRVQRIFQVRSQTITGIRDFLNRRGFIEVETPILQPSPGGALARPFITHHNALDQDFYLRIAPELYLKRLIVGGMDRVYELGRIFRNEGIDATHNPEFTMMESYEAYADYTDVMEMVETMVSEVCQQVLGTTEAEFNGSVISFKPPWQRLDLRQAIIKGANIDFNLFPDTESLRAEMQRLNIEVDPQKDRGRLIDDLLSESVQPNLIQPTFLMDYPVEMSPLAKAKPDNALIVERFEAFTGGLEIANAFTELNDPVEQRQRFIEQAKQYHEEGEVTAVDEEYLLALEHGMPPTGGLGVGIDRLVMLLTDQPTIREVVLFPQLKEKLTEKTG